MPTIDLPLLLLLLGLLLSAPSCAVPLSSTPPLTDPPDSAVSTFSTASAAAAAAAHPVVQSLSGWQWSLSNANSSIHLQGNCTVPGSVHLDLHSHGLLDDLFYLFDPITYEWVSNEPHWT